MATSKTSTEIDNLLTTWFSRRMIANLERVIFSEMAFFDVKTETSREDETMSQTLPKDILVHLEKGDRSDEFLEDRMPQVQEGVDFSDPLMMSQAVNQMRNSEINQMARQMQQAQQFGQSIGMASAGLLGGGPRW